ncbi:MAG TPA: nickel pincer cofactor biosynthesis protein LarB [Candidatus Thermoplasmatota archaeon]|nr:nickel pincer cofactor biosynthesis protein LarB [Candidatus Thermoplasmatota archaeon]
MSREDFRLDLDREERTGTPEIVLAEGKTDAQLASVVAAFHRASGRVVVSRLDPARRAVLDDLPHAWHEEARIAVVGLAAPPRRGGRVAVVAAGMADARVAEEARVVADEMGADVETFHDVGVAGLHRLLDVLPALRRADAVVACAGREGALPTVVAGLVAAPVVAVPVSTGYGAGEAALHAMLQSCSPLVVVNVDAGVVAGAMAARIANQSAAAALRRGPLARERELTIQSFSGDPGGDPTRVASRPPSQARNPHANRT